MELDSALRIVGFASVAVVVVAWLTVSLSRSAHVQARVSWIAACGLYLALACLFASLSRRAWEADNLLVLVAFGFLLAVFAGGFLVSVVKTALAFARGRGGDPHATH